MSTYVHRTRQFQRIRDEQRGPNFRTPLMLLSSLAGKKGDPTSINAVPLHFHLHSPQDARPCENSICESFHPSLLLEQAEPQIIPTTV